MKKLPIVLLSGALLLGVSSCKMKDPHVQVTGDMMKWHTVTLEVPGHYSGEFDHKNPFMDYRLDVEFVNGENRYFVPGYFAANGSAGAEGTFSGNRWHVKFTPDKVGDWTYRVRFYYGEGIAVSDTSDGGEPMPMNGYSGTFTIGPSDKQSPDFRARGRLVNTGHHYLVCSETGEVFIKTGAGSPENFLAYAGFDQTPPTHYYAPHAGDWNVEDPDWGDKAGRNIIGAVNYLASKGVNSIYMLTMNVMGDGNDVWPWVNKYERTRYDVSKLEQWEWLFSHMESRGMMIHLLTQERENQLLLDQGEVWDTRRLYYRELIARFGHHLAMTINLGEENGENHNTPLGQTTRMRKEMARYIASIDPYGHLLVVHTHSGEKDIEAVMDPLLGFKDIDGPSLQIGRPDRVHQSVIRWREASEKAGKPWVCCLDEIGPATKGVVPDEVDPGHDALRRDCLWGTLMAGGAGVSWYFGYSYPHNDLNLEDFRSRENVWEQSRIARNYVEALPLQDMVPSDHFILEENAWCLADPGAVYVIYLPAGTRSFTLRDQVMNGTFTTEWFNPRTGETFEGDHIQPKGLQRFNLPGSFDQNDWVVKVSRAS
jgi:hypothetical protein